MTNQQAKLFLQVLRQRVKSTGDELGITIFTALVRECTLDDPVALQAELDAGQLAQLIAMRDNQDANRPALDQEIIDLTP